MNSTLRIRNTKALPAVAMAALAFAAAGVTPKRFLAMLPAVAMAVLAFAAAGVSAQPGELLTLDIKAQKAGSALVTLAKSSGVQIMLTEGPGAKVQVEELKGEYRFEDALAILLTDTGLTFEYAAENVVLVKQSEELQEVEAADDSVVTEDDEPIELASQIVTGSRLQGGDPSARVYSFSAEDIARRGVSSLEEFFRKMPWAFSSLTTQTTSTGLPGRDGQEIFFGSLGQGSFDTSGVGVSAVNLRGLGAAQTLVLLNGRRIAGTGGQQDDFVNLLNVPLSSIERVDIQLDGASAVYGSDAIGGVVNFITKKNYRGLSATYRHEYSSTDAAKTNASITAGYTWGRGNLTTTLTRSASEPITNEKTGWDSLDLRPLLGPDFDRRIRYSGQPGVACVLEKRASWHPALPPSYGCPRFGAVWYQLPAGHSGVDATIDDFNTFGYNQAPTPLDEISPQNGIDSTNTSLSLNVEQYLTNDLRVFADLVWSLNESYREHDRRISFPFIIPASNAYNPFGRHMRVEYAAVYESENGLMPAQFDESENESRTIAAGFIWNFGAGHELQVEFNRTKSWRESSELRGRPTRNILDPTAKAFYAALASPDPARAINVFGDGTVQGTAFEEFLTVTDGPFYGVNETRQYNVTLRGQLFHIWGGPTSYSMGAEYRENIIFGGRPSESYVTYEGIDEDIKWRSSSQYDLGVARPSREIQAYFAEMALPLFGPDNGRTGLRSLILTLQLRYDVNESVGALGGGLEQRRIPARLHYWDPDEGFTYTDTTWTQQDLDPTLGKARNGDLSPRAGIQYQPSINFTWRAAWRRSFTAPNWGDQFSPTAERPPRSFFSTPYSPKFDPYDPDGRTEITRDLGVVTVTVPYTPDIEPEYSDSWSVGFDWSPEAIPGLRWTVDWSKVDFTNRIRSSSQWINSNPEYVFDNPLVAERNERGDLVQVNNRDINIAEDYNELITTDLEYAFDTRFGNFTPRIGYTRFIEDFSQVAADAPKESDLGTQNGADRYKWEGSLTWLWGRFAADLFVYYSPAYLHDKLFYCTYFHVLRNPDTRCSIDSIGEYLTRDVSSLTTVDLTLTYRLDNGLRIRAGGANILDRAAPVTLSGSSQPYDPTRWDARGQVLFLELNWEM